MIQQIEINWRWREHRDGDVGTARFKCFDLHIQDMDGDAAAWTIKRGQLCIAMGTERDTEKAVEKIKEVVGFLYRAVEHNDFVNRELPKLKAQGLA